MASTPDPVPLSYSNPNLEKPTLARHMGLAALVIYGVGDMLGAGVYGLVGKAAGIMGNAVWLAFLGSMVAALLTGLSYACIGSRYPRAAGAAYVTHRAYGFPLLSYLVGLTVVASGLTSMATGSRIIAGFVNDLLGPARALPLELIVAVFLVLLTGIVFRGIRESMWVNIACTSIEVFGLAVVVFVGVRYWGSINYLEMPTATNGTASTLSLMLVLQGAVLTFFSFIGFEDILNVAEEVKEPRRNVPLGLILALCIATCVYMAVSISAVSVLPHNELAQSKSPLVDVVRKAAPWFPPVVFAAISIFAVANTALLNYVMGSRLLYGMARQGMLPSMLGRVHATRRTPHIAIMVLLAVVLILSLSGDIGDLASATSLLLLGVFVVVNLGLILLKRRPNEPRGSFEVPAIVPALGAIVCLSLIFARIYGPIVERKPDQSLFVALKAPLIALAIGVVILILFALVRPKNVIADEVDEVTPVGS